MRTVTFFSSPTCHQCHEAKKWWNEVVEGNTCFDYTVEDTDKDIALAYKYKVMALPTFLITEDGKEIDRISGYVSKKIMLDFLNRNKVCLGVK
jgi:thioredoxin-related protein